MTDWSSIRRGSYLLIPLPVFVLMLIGGYSIMLGAFWAVTSSVAVSYFSRESAMTPRRLIEASVAAANAVVPVALA